MSLSTYYLEYGRHVARLRRRRRAYAPTSNAASHDHHEKINSWVSFSFLYEYGAPLGDPSAAGAPLLMDIESFRTFRGMSPSLLTYNLFDLEVMFSKTDNTPSLENGD